MNWSSSAVSFSGVGEVSLVANKLKFYIYTLFTIWSSVDLQPHILTSNKSIWSIRHWLGQDCPEGYWISTKKVKLDTSLENYLFQNIPFWNIPNVRWNYRVRSEECGRWSNAQFLHTCQLILNLQQRYPEVLHWTKAHSSRDLNDQARQHYSTTTVACVVI
jgi:hypothetical protein